MTLGNVSFPAGTTFQLFKSDGVTPLVDTNGNSTPDTGTLPVNGTYAVVVHAILPPGASGLNVNYTVNVVATSRANATVNAIALLRKACTFSTNHGRYDRSVAAEQ